MLHQLWYQSILLKTLLTYEILQLKGEDLYKGNTAYSMLNMDEVTAQCSSLISLDDQTVHMRETDLCKTLLELHVDGRAQEYSY